jgi:hypothetical protein
MSDITPTQDQALMKLAQRTVGFLVQIEEDGIRYLTPAGSGTIVSMKGVVFLLTAGHVAKAIMDAPLAGIYGVKAPGKAVRPVEFKPALCATIIHWDGTVSPEGPDIAAIKMPPDC